MDTESQVNGVDQAVSRKHTPFKRRLVYLVSTYVVFLVLLLAIEISTRLTMTHISSLDLFVVSSQQKAQVADATHGGIFEGDPLLLWRLKPNLDHAVWDYTVLSTNSEHLRAEEPYRGLSPKKPGAVRIVCLGDSVTFGFRVPVVWPDKPTEFDPEWLPFPMLIEKELSGANPERAIDVVTMAVPGYTSHQGLTWLRRDVDKLQPDLLIVSFGWNDASLSDVPDRQAVITSRYAVAVRTLIDSSQAFAHATHWLRAQQAAAETSKNQTPLRRRPRSRVSQPEYLENMLEISRLASQHGAKVIVMAAPYRDHSPEAPEGDLMLQYRIALGTTMRERGIPFLEIRELTEAAYPSNEGWFGERIHPNHMGHRLIASELLKMIDSKQMFADLKILPLVP
jgi:lysophospholipase L1-like esterase